MAFVGTINPMARVKKLKRLKFLPLTEIDPSVETRMQKDFYAVKSISRVRLRSCLNYFIPFGGVIFLACNKTVLSFSLWGWFNKNVQIRRWFVVAAASVRSASPIALSDVAAIRTLNFQRNQLPTILQNMLTTNWITTSLPFASVDNTAMPL